MTASSAVLTFSMSCEIAGLVNVRSTPVQRVVARGVLAVRYGLRGDGIDRELEVGDVAAKPLPSSLLRSRVASPPSIDWSCPIPTPPSFCTAPVSAAEVPSLAAVAYWPTAPNCTTPPALVCWLEPSPTVTRVERLRFERVFHGHRGAVRVGFGVGALERGDVVEIRAEQGAREELSVGGGDGGGVRRLGGGGAGESEAGGHRHRGERRRRVDGRGLRRSRDADVVNTGVPS